MVKIERLVIEDNKVAKYVTCRRCQFNYWDIVSCCPDCGNPTSEAV